MRYRVALSCVVAGLALLPATASSRPFAPWPDFDSLATRFPGAPAVCLLDEREATLDYLGGDDYGKHEIVTSSIAILDPAKAAPWLEQEIANTSWQRIGHLEARTWSGPTTSVEVKGANIFDVPSYADYVLFSDVRAKKFAFPAAAARTVVEFRYEYLSRSDFRLTHTFARTIPTLCSRAIMNIPMKWLAEGFNETVRARGVSADGTQEILNSPRGDMLRLSWELDDVPAIRSEPWMPPLADIAPHLSVLPQPFKGPQFDWSRVGKDYWSDQFVKQMDRDPTLTAMAAQLTAGATTPEDRLARAARFVARDIRYVAIELGIGGYQPHRASEVLRNRYGDCKDKVCLLLALLGAMGIDGEPALVRTAEEGLIDTSLVTLNQFDHMIARVRLGDRTVWVDPTASSCPPGELPWVDQSTFVLVLGAAGARMELTPTAEGPRNELATDLDGSLAPDGSLSGWLTFEGRGQAGAAHRAAFLARDPAESRRLAAALVEDRLPGARLLEFTVTDPDSVDLPFRLHARFERPGGALVVDRSLVLLPQIVVVDHLIDAFSDSSRIYAVELDYLRSYRDRVRIAAPPGYTVDTPPPAVSLQGAYFAYERKASGGPGTFEVESTVSNQALTVPPGEYRVARAELGRLRAVQMEGQVRFRPSP